MLNNKTSHKQKSSLINIIHTLGRFLILFFVVIRNLFIPKKRSSSCPIMFFSIILLVSTIFFMSLFVFFINNSLYNANEQDGTRLREQGHYYLEEQIVRGSEIEQEAINNKYDFRRSDTGNILHDIPACLANSGKLVFFIFTLFSLALIIFSLKLIKEPIKNLSIQEFGRKKG